ncbi:metal cation transporter, ZIP family [Ancylostoma ceylanicum]|uniref:Metal cation transporter, ZIP family n=1 Tax=Ancylostoma ceylanicum TaxID=53326 RepID=A0A0D6LFE2_9BILA|nr:metal cation transporter, ZIP family [Ancylostoma ceylanicum]
MDVILYVSEMHSHARWLDILFPLNRNGMDMLESAPNEARDSLRALLLLTLFALTFASGMNSEALESYEKVGMESNFPVAEAAVAGGLLMVLTIEQVVLAMQERGWLVSGHVHVHDEEERRPLSRSSSVAVDEEKNSVIGVALLVLALSLHALFEGLSLAVISDASKLLEVFAALILHKCIIGFSLGVRLVESGLKTPWVALCSCLFSVQVLIGGLGGMEIMSLLSGGDRMTAALVSTILQGIACGTFLYITTFEILPHELEKPGSRMAKLACLFTGVFIMIKQLSSVMSTNATNNQNAPLAAKTVNIRLNMKRAAVISVVKESSYLALLCDEVEAECDGSRSFAVSAQHARIVSAPVHEAFVDLLVLRNTSKFVPPVDRGRKNMRAAAWDEQRVNRPQLYVLAVKGWQGVTKEEP